MRVLVRAPLNPYSVEERFRRHVLRGAPDACWEWTSARRKGYGTFKVQAGELGVDRRRDVYAHRVVFYLTHGRWPEPLARHTCDNPPCCNPAHIVEGTWQDNMTDKLVRGRCVNPAGAASVLSKLTQEQVDALRGRYARGEVSQSRLAAEYGISQSAVSKIIRGQRWPQCASS